MISFSFSSQASCPGTSRWRAARAETGCRGGLPTPWARREVLPSMATISSSRSRRPDTQAAKHSVNGSPGRAFITSVSVSCEGMPASNGRRRRRKAILRLPRHATSTKSSAPAITPHSARSRISGRGKPSSSLGEGLRGRKNDRAGRRISWRSPDGWSETRDHIAPPGESKAVQAIAVEVPTKALTSFPFLWQLAAILPETLIT